MRVQDSFDAAAPCAPSRVAARLYSPEPAGPVTGKVLVLDNERTLEGDIERVGDQYRLRRTVGETWVPAGRALRLCDSLEEAFRMLQEKSAPGGRRGGRRWPPCRSRHVRDGGRDADAARGLARRSTVWAVDSLDRCLTGCRARPDRVRFGWSALIHRHESVA